MALLINKNNDDSVVAKPTDSEVIVESSGKMKEDQPFREKNSQEKELIPAPTTDHITSTQKNTVKETKSEEPSQEQPSQEQRLQSALKAGNYSLVRQMADNGYSPAYLPLAKHYLKTPSTHNLADKYARKAKNAGIKGANGVIEDLEALGYYD